MKLHRRDENEAGIDVRTQLVIGMSEFRGLGDEYTAPSHHQITQRWEGRWQCPFRGLLRCATIPVESAGINLSGVFLTASKEYMGMRLTSKGGQGGQAEGQPS